jgi:DMSO reductase anchor subunit
MRPTLSIICFTVLSGAGYGIWFVLGAGLLPLLPFCKFAPPATSGQLSLGLCAYYPLLIPLLLAVGFVLVTIGLLCSLGHLGKPLRAWRALSQWRSSWLSREGVAAIATYVPAVAVIALPFFANSPGHGLDFGAAYTPLFDEVYWTRIAGGVLALGCVVTVCCTAHIYSSLKPIRAWHNRFVTPSYLVLALHAGLLWTWLLSALPSALPASQYALGRSAIVATLAFTSIVAALVKLFYWRSIDRAPQIGAGRATGLDALGSVRTFEAPHTEENYLTHEMGFVLARRHAKKLRGIALIVAFTLPLALALLSLAWPRVYAMLSVPALVAGMLGLFVERWLFFAEARHAVIAYYGR